MKALTKLRTNIIVLTCHIAKARITFKSYEALYDDRVVHWLSCFDSGATD